MIVRDIAQMALPVVAAVALAPLLGGYMARVFSGERTFLTPVLAPVERLVYRATQVDPDDEMPWTAYATCMLLLNAVGMVLLYALLRLQGFLPLNPSHAPGMGAGAAFNTAVSFVTNTDWQVYSGETQVSHLSQMAGLTWQNFVSAGTGIAVAVALIRGLVRREARTVGNFWADLTRSWLYVLLPGALALALVFVSQGAVQTLAARTEYVPLDPAVASRAEPSALAVGPVASQVAIKVLGTNGGGFFNANSAHPFENPTPLTNALQVVAMLAIPAALTITFGRMAGNPRQGWVLLLAMLVLFIAGTAIVYASERAGNPLLTGVGADQTAGAAQAGGNMVGKEVRFGVAGSSVFANSTTAVSCGAVDGSHSSLTPLAGGVAMLNIALGEVVFGGAGSGLYGMLVFALLAVFVAGLMVGRTPEYLGKKIGPREMKLAMLAVLALEAAILVGAGAAIVAKPVLAAMGSSGPHGLSEVLYAFTSGVGNNGSAFASLRADALVLEVSIGIAMLVGRYLFMVPVLALAGAMAAKRQAPPSAGTFPTDGGMFVMLLVAVVLIVGALTFFPAYALGPVLEHLLMCSGAVF